MGVFFEELKEEHLSEVLDIYNYYVNNSTATFHLQSLNIAEMSELVLFNSPIYKAFVMNVDEKICGYCILTQFRKREAYDITAEVTVYLHHECTGKGLGTHAVKHIEALAVKNGIHTLVASICGENQESIKLFQKNGYTECAYFKEVGKKFGRLLDLVYYQKLLNS